MKEREGSLFPVQNSVEWKQSAFPEILSGRELIWQVLSHLRSVSQGPSGNASGTLQRVITELPWILLAERMLESQESQGTD